MFLLFCSEAFVTRRNYCFVVEMLNVFPEGAVGTSFWLILMRGQLQRTETGSAPV